MAAFTDAEKGRIMRHIVRDLKADGLSDIPYSSLDVRAAVQAIRDILDGVAFRNAVSGAIDTALAPNTMTGPRKKRLYGRVIQELFGGEVS